MSLAELLPAATGEFVKVMTPAPHVRLLMLDRPDAMNSWHAAMRAEMASAVRELSNSVPFWSQPVYATASVCPCFTAGPVPTLMSPT